jgi:zinc protease
MSVRERSRPARVRVAMLTLGFAWCACRPAVPAGRAGGGSVTSGDLGARDGSGPESPAASLTDAPEDAGPPALPAAATEARLPTVHRARLPNGIELAVVEHRALPVLHVRVLLRGAGSRFDPPGRPGLAAFMAELLREGAGAMDSRAIAEAFDGAGARLATETDADATTLALDTLPERAEQTLALLGAMLVGPTFSSVELERLRRRELDRIAQSMADPPWLSQRPMHRALFGEAHPYGAYDTTAAALRAIGRDEVSRFHREHVRGGAITVVAVGSMAPETFTLMASRAFGAIPSGGVARVEPPAPPSRAARSILLVDRPESQQAYVRVGRVGPRRTDPSWPALSVANQVLGAAPSSRLFVDLRERRSLTYGVYSRMSARVDPGVVSASGATRIERTGEFVRALLEHLDRMGTEPVPEDELARARRVVQNRLPTGIATAGDVASRVAELSLFGLEDRALDTFLREVSGVDAAAVREVGRRFYATGDSVIVVVGPARTLRPILAGLGPVTVLRPGQ